MSRALFFIKTLPIRIGMEWRLRARRKSRQCIRKYREPKRAVSTINANRPHRA